MGQTLYVAAAQIKITGEIQDNLKTILETTRRCASAGVDAVLFPETALTGYSPDIGHGRDASEWNRIEDGLAEIALQARELGIWIVVGTEAWSDRGWVNRLIAYSDKGEVVAAYDKIHLTSPDTQYYQPGAEAVLFDLKGIKVGLQICYDVRFPEGYRSLLGQGAEVILQGFCGAGRDTWKVPVMGAHVRSRAAESGCFVVAANVAGPLQIVVSQIVNPLGLVLAQANQDREEVIKAHLDTGCIADSEIRRDYLARFSGHTAG